LSGNDNSASIRIEVLGPESSGKSTLSSRLAEHWEATLVPEFARTYLSQLDRDYQQHDLLIIAREQFRRLREASGPLIIADTGLLVIKIWSEVRFGRVDEWIESRLALQEFDLHLLCFPDIPWSDDPLREHPDLPDRLALFELYEKHLREGNHSYEVIQGRDPQLRFERANQYIGKLVSS
jgi:nicotinamide riboside kinase